MSLYYTSILKQSKYEHFTGIKKACWKIITCLKTTENNDVFSTTCLHESFFNLKNVLVVVAAHDRIWKAKELILVDCFTHHQNYKFDDI